MADNDVIVTVSGAAFSLLFYENVRSSGDQMGFLLGDVLVFITKKVTDSDRQVEHEKRRINIDSVIACPKTEVFHDHKGTVNIEKVQNYIKENKKRVVGWFRFRRHRNLTPSVRDKILHKEFAELFGSSSEASKEDFVMCLLNNSVNDTRATHKFRHVFLRYRNRSMEPLPLRISNLGNDASRLDSSDYKPIPVKHLVQEPDAFTRFLQNLPPTVSRKSGVDAIKMIQELAEQRLSKLIPDLCESEDKVAQLEMQILQLRETMRTGSNNLMQKKEGVSLVSSDLNESSITSEKSCHNERGNQEFVMLSNVIPKPKVSTERVHYADSASDRHSVNKERKKSIPIEKSGDQDCIKSAVNIQLRHRSRNDETINVARSKRTVRSSMSPEGTKSVPELIEKIEQRDYSARNSGVGTKKQG